MCDKNPWIHDFIPSSMKMECTWYYGYVYEILNQRLGRNEKGRAKFGVGDLDDHCEG